MNAENTKLSDEMMQEVSGGNAGDIGDARYDPVCTFCGSRDYYRIRIVEQTSTWIKYQMHCNNCDKDFYYVYTCD